MVEGEVLEDVRGFLKSRVILPRVGSKSTTLQAASVLNLDNDQLLLVGTRLNDEHSSVVLHIREISGKETSLNIESLIKSSSIEDVYEVNLLNERSSEVSEALEFKGYETKFIELTLK